MAPEIDGRVLITEIAAPDASLESLAGRMARVEITAAQDYDLVGRVTSILDAPPEFALSAPGAAFGTRTDPALRILG